MVRPGPDPGKDSARSRRPPGEPARNGCAALQSRGMAGDGIFVVAGEPSGDTHAAHLLRALAARIPGLSVRGFGGPRMASAGMDLLHDLASDAVMGLFPVLKALPRLRTLLRRAEEEIRERRPAAVLLVDYPGFNIRLAAAAKRAGVPVIWYISPQVWAWAKGRVRKLARVVDLMLVILPFEEEVYRGSGLRTVYVGHPLLDHLRATPPDEAVVERLRGGPGPLLGLFPGSRRHVVRSLLPVFLDAARRLRATPEGRDLRVAIALAQEVHRPVLDALPHGDLSPEVLVARPYEVMASADIALASSGTTTLEMAAHLVPFVIGYRVSPVLYALGRLLISVPHIGLVNLVAGRGLVPEHVGVRSFAAAAARDLHRLLSDPSAREAQVEGLRAVRARLDRPGSYDRAAEAIVPLIAGRP